jgi:hypothetical protein
MFLVKKDTNDKLQLVLKSNDNPNENQKRKIKVLDEETYIAVKIFLN